MVIHYTKEYLTRLMVRDKFKGDYAEWFKTTPLGEQFKLIEIKEDGPNVNLVVESIK